VVATRIDGEDDVWLRSRLTRAPGERGARRVLVLLHGMGGSDASTYVLATGRHAVARGWSVLRANMRGCGDDDIFCARLSHAGLASDLLAVVRDAAQRFEHVAVCGFSLGAHLTALMLARHAGELPNGLVAGAAVSPPLDLAGCADAVGLRQNRVYQRFFMQGLHAGYARIQQRANGLYEAGRTAGLRSVREFDDRITAPYGGYGSADKYYETNTAGPLLAQVRVPLLILAASDDPVIPAAGVDRWQLPAAGNVVREMTRTGGHVGFVGRTRAPGSFWAAERVVDFIDAAEAAG
jgi:predicted alpha/beta-fold hydrolase